MSIQQVILEYTGSQMGFVASKIRERMIENLYGVSKSNQLSARAVRTSQ